MFFSISTTKQDNFPIIHKFPHFFVMLDNGWNTLTISNKTIFYKGYCIDYNLDTLVKNSIYNNRLFKGNFCIIEIDVDIRIYTDKYRSCKIQYNDFEVTNLYNASYKTVWADKGIRILGDLSKVNDYGIVDEIPQNILNKFDNEKLTEHDVLNNIHDIIDNDITVFLQHYNNTPIKIFLSGGLDSMLVFSYIQKHTDNYEIISHAHTEYDEFWCKNRHRISDNNWSYKQIHSWGYPTLLASGTPGDEYMLRNPKTVNLYLNYFNTSVLEEIQKFDNPKTLYHYKHFSKPSYKEEILKQSQEIQNIKQLSYDQFCYYLCNNVVNDIQHHHLGYTLTFTPLRNINIFEQILKLPLESTISQALNGDISRKLISMNNQDLLQYVSLSKNNEAMYNIWDFFKKHLHSGDNSV